MRYIDLKHTGTTTSIPDPNDHDLIREWLYVQNSELDQVKIPKDPNPRGQNTNTSVAKKIREGLEDPCNQHFHLFNRGLLIVASKTEHISDTVIRVYLEDEEEESNAKYGLADGGTTYEVIKEALLETATAGNKYVTIEVISNVKATEDTSSDLILNQTVNSRNTSVQVKDSSLQDHRGMYDFIKEALEGTPYEGKIRFKENADGIVPIEDVVKMLFLLNPEQEPVERRLCHGPNVYGQTYPLKAFERNHESYQKFGKILPEVLFMFDYIGANAATLYNNGYKKQVKAGNTKIFTQKTYLESLASPFLGRRSNYDRFPVKAVWFACFNTLRLLLKIRGDRFVWACPFEEVQAIIESSLHKMIAKSNEIIKEMEKHPDKAARDGYILWEGVYQVFDRHLKDYLGVAA